jgi:tyrosine-specific transport protein
MDVIPYKHGNVLGASLLIAGCCIGAGMLGLPVLSAMAGFKPSLLMFVICWLFMVGTGLLLLEVNLWFKEEIHIVSMAERTLGKPGKAVSWLVFLFLFYSLMVAYTAASGALMADFVNQYFDYALPNGMGSLIFCLIFGLLLYLGTGALDWFNRFLMFGLIASYVVLISTGLPHIDTALLEHRDWNAATLVIPALIVSFGFHNLVPSLTTYLDGKQRSLVKAIIIGSSIPLGIYLLWEMLILGLVPLQGFQQALDQGEIATEALKSAVGISWILDIAQIFAFFAIVTSLLSVALSFMDFLADGLQIRKTPTGKFSLACLVLIPPLICSIIYPKIFLVALNYAGGYGAVILFGILPVLMVWKGRYIQKLGHPQLVPGGKVVLVLILLFAACVIGLQLINDLN